MLPLTSVVLVIAFELAAAGLGIFGVARVALYVPHSCSGGGRCSGRRFAGAGT